MIKYKFFIWKSSLVVKRCLTSLDYNFVIFALVGLINANLIVAESAAAEDQVARAEAWFNKIKSIKADFVQVASDGTSAEGKLVFRRPSQMKLTYQSEDGSKGLQLITSKLWLYVDRPDEKLVTIYPLSETPLSLILVPKVSLRLDGYETRVIPSSANIFQILIVKEEGEGAGQLTLEFSEKPFQFRRWTVLDSAGIKTSVTLFNLAFDAPIPNATFKRPNYLPQN